jgi:hypothetical protein
MAAKEMHIIVIASIGMCKIICWSRHHTKGCEVYFDWFDGYQSHFFAHVGRRFKNNFSFPINKV